MNDVSTARYDRIGWGYANRRLPDPRIAAQIRRALEGAESIVNVGAGAGSYEPRGPAVLAVEPSRVMIDQRGPEQAPVVRARGEALPFPDDSFDAALASLTIHHWGDQRRGLAELSRVARRQVIFTFDPTRQRDLWFIREYAESSIPEEDPSPDISLITSVLQSARVEVVPVPHDCVDGFLGAYWRRPELYLEPDARASISLLAQLDPEQLAPGLEHLARDLASGEWHARHRELLELEELDLGYRLIVAG